MALEGGPCRVKRHWLSQAKLIYFSSKQLPFSTFFHVKKKKLSQNTRTQNSDQVGDPRRNNPSQYNLRLLLPQVKEQEGDEPPLVGRRRKARRQPHRETRKECIEQLINTLTELVNTLVAAFGKNAANVAPAIPPGIPLANAEGEEVSPPQEGRNVTSSEARTDIDACQRRARRRR